MAVIDTTMGALQICTFLSFLWFGIVLHQAISYFTKYPQDRLAFKLVTGLCVLICCLDTSFDAAWCYRWGVTNYGNLAVMQTAPFELPATLVLMSVSTVTVQSFFAWRLWKIASSRNWVVPICVLICTLIQFAMILYIAPIIALHPAFSDVEASVFPMAWIWLGSCALGDLLITITMIYYLHVRAKGVRTSKGLFHQILYRCIQSNALSLVSQIVVIVLFKLHQTGFFYLITIFTIPKTLSFSLFASLNSRRASEQSMDRTVGSGGGATSGNQFSTGAHLQPSVFNVRSGLQPGPSQFQGLDNSTPRMSNVSVQVNKFVTIDVEKEEHWEPSARQMRCANGLISPDSPASSSVLEV